MTSVDDRSLEDDDEYGQDDECGNCGGEGVVYDCFDGFCENAEEGCDDCARRCDWCRPTKPKVRGKAFDDGQLHQPRRLQ